MRTKKVSTQSSVLRAPVVRVAIAALHVCTKEQLKQVVQSLRAACAFDLGLAVYGVNPVQRRNGPPPGTLEPLARLEIIGARKDNRAAAVRHLRQNLHVPIREAVTILDNASAATPYGLPDGPLFAVVADAKYLLSIGVQTRVTLLEKAPPSWHDVTFREEVSSICTG